MTGQTTLHPGDRWASHSREYGYTSKTRHIVRRGGITSVCGVTASHPEIWRGDKRKPVCPACLREYDR